MDGNGQVNVDDYNLWFENRFTFASQTPRRLEPLGNRVPKAALHTQVLAATFDHESLDISRLLREPVKPMAAQELDVTAGSYLEPTTELLWWRRGLNLRSVGWIQPAGATATDFAFEELVTTVFQARD